MKQPSRAAAAHLGLGDPSSSLLHSLALRRPVATTRPGEATRFAHYAAARSWPGTDALRTHVTASRPCNGRLRIWPSSLEHRHATTTRSRASDTSPLLVLGVMDGACALLGPRHAAGRVQCPSFTPDASHPAPRRPPASASIPRAIHDALSAAEESSQRVLPGHADPLEEGSVWCSHAGEPRLTRPLGGAHRPDRCTAGPHPLPRSPARCRPQESQHRRPACPA
jgi:hypothetical protein